MAVRLSGKNEVLRRPSLRVLSGGLGEADPSIEAGGPAPETLDPIGRSLDQLDSSLQKLAPILTGAKPGQGQPSDSVLWGELHQLLAKLGPSSAPSRAQPAPTPTQSSPKPPASS